MKTNKEILNFLGLARRARRLCAGTDVVISSIQNGKTNLVFIANDASEKTIDKITSKCHFYNVLVNNTFSTEELSNAIGTQNSKVLGIEDPKMSEAILKKIERGNINEG